MNTGRLALLACLIWIVLSAGCGQRGPRVVKVSGNVTRAGKPVSKLMVNFYPEKGRPSWGITDQDGNYKLNYDHTRDGAVTGNHKVWVKVQASSAKEEYELSKGLIKLHPEMSAIVQKYGENASPLTAEVKEDNQVIDLKLD